MKKEPKLAIAALTNTPVIVIGSTHHDVTKDFHQALMSWICEGELPDVGRSKTQQLKSSGKVHFEITLKRFV